MTSSSPNAKLSRVELALALTEAGYDISPATLAGFGSRGGGPPYDIFNNRARYELGPALEWASSRVSPPRRRVAIQGEPAHAA